MNLIAELDAAEVPFCTLFPILRGTKSLDRLSREKRPILLAVDALRGSRRGSGLKQGAIHCGVLVAKQRSHFGGTHQLHECIALTSSLQEALHDLMAPPRAACNFSEGECEAVSD